MTEARVHAMIASVCLGATRDVDWRALFEEHGLEPADAEALARAGPGRLLVYRRLVRNTLAGVVHKMMPRTRARLNRAVTASFDASLDEFFESVAPRTHYLRDVPAEFLAWAAPRWRAREELPRWAADLAAHELVHFTVAAVPASREARGVAEVAVDRPLVFTEAMRLVDYAFAVHTLPEDEDDATDPEERAVSLLAYRDAEHAVRFLEVTPTARAIVERLVLGATVRDALTGLGLADADLADVARLLADLGERGVLLGGAT